MRGRTTRQGGHRYGRLSRAHAVAARDVSKRATLGGARPAVQAHKTFTLSLRARSSSSLATAAGAPISFSRSVSASADSIEDIAARSNAAAKAEAAKKQAALEAGVEEPKASWALRFARLPLHDKDVLVLRSPDSRHFLKRTCAHYWGPFGNVAEVRERLTSYFQRLTSYGGRCGRFQCRCVRRRALRR